MNFRIHLGPMDLDNFQKFLPDQTSFDRLRAWTADYVGEEFFWDLQLILKKEEVPPTSLGGDSRLGWTTFLSSDAMPFGRDADDVILDGADIGTN
jgi:type VI secretion system protein ImpH